MPERHPEFTEFRDRVLQDPVARAAYRRAQLRQLTYGMDKRQARRLRRRLARSGGQDA